MKQRIGIYGGSFNPIHIGHTQLGVALCSMNLIDELWFLVSPHNPLKQNTTLLADEARLELTRLAVEEPLKVSDFEMNLPRPSFMVHTLEKLREAYPEYEFILVIGADNWLSFDHWMMPDEILRHHRVIVYPRPGSVIDVSTLPANATLVDTPLIDISSTWIREQITNNPRYNGEGLNPKVWEEIKRKRYYFSINTTA